MFPTNIAKILFNNKKYKYKILLHFIVKSQAFIYFCRIKKTRTKKMVKFLIVRLSSIGDIVLTTPVVRILKQQVEESEIHYLTKPQYASILENNPHVTKVHIYKSKDKDFINNLRDEFFDYVIDLHKNIKTHFLKNKLGIHAFTFDKLNWEKWIMVNFKKNKLPKKHIIERYLESTKVFDVNIKGLPSKSVARVSTAINA